MICLPSYHKCGFACTRSEVLKTRRFACTGADSCRSSLEFISGDSACTRSEYLNKLSSRVHGSRLLSESPPPALHIISCGFARTRREVLKKRASHADESIIFLQLCVNCFALVRNWLRLAAEVRRPQAARASRSAQAVRAALAAQAARAARAAGVAGAARHGGSQPMVRNCPKTPFRKMARLPKTLA